MPASVRILADENIPGLPHAFGEDVTVQKMPGRDIQRSDLSAVDALLLRSVTRVNEDLLKGTSVKFVGTATIGLDHIDLDYLNASNIGFAYAPGSNAQSVVEYVLAAIAFWLQRTNRTFKGLKVGIVGVGRIGGLLQKYLQQMGVHCLLCDPPRQAQEPNETYYSLQSMSEADVISFHVPLTQRGPWPTRHLIDVAFLNALSADQLLINTARGDILDNQMALYYVQNTASPVNLVLDVWQNEPMINAQLVQHCLLATPHIAGYAIEGKWRATAMLCQALSDYFQVPFKRTALDRNIRVNDPWQPQSNENKVSKLLSYYDISQDDQALRNEIKNLPQSFDKLRKNYPTRHEFLASV
ncbi:erythronate-4-phosphate dehydrogenase [Marinicella pacifica]|uniref:Erythronate-4-phosphate dehydrogenase n=1 Tax=Marinicella pacifica TaxID=1171543 RepID=A0A917CEB8_9GAMM|nr:4-phosphoerythronate dehydrogenase [Marinicella pacifica]GGF83592.1 erythronate-4-phosphate dehydrogenase [Marinicella pacifica]